jgi:hypothetical protein
LVIDWQREHGRSYPIRILGISKDRADEIARIVRRAFSESENPTDWVKRLIEKADMTPEKAEIFACGWFAGRYAGVSEVFNVVQREMDKMEKGREKDNYPPTEGYA